MKRAIFSVTNSCWNTIPFGEGLYGDNCFAPTDSISSILIGKDGIRNVCIKHWLMIAVFSLIISGACKLCVIYNCTSNLFIPGH